jgi:ABC-type branched-subunit amino acid transport system substrate-binding protein
MSRTIALPEEAGARPPVVVDQIAVEEALARAGGAVQLSAPAFQFERYGWGTPDDTLSILAGRPEVLGIVGHIGPDEPAPAVLAERLEIPVVDAAAAGPDGGGTPNRWVFRCGRYGRDAQAALLDALLARPKLPRIAVIRTPGEESARRLDFWALRGSERGNPAVLDLEWNPGLDDPGPALSRMRRAKVEVVLTWADAQATALLLRRMREGGVRALLVGGEGIVSDDFVRLAGPEPGAVAAVAPCRHAVADDDVGTESVRDRSVLAANHLLAAIRDSAADRSAVRDSLERMRSESAATLDRGVWRRCHPSAIAPGGGRARR